ncbi:MAG: late competence development ComFB family protein [Clostridiales Family XIII bacterium]|jgi:hypothetical protein|nr:late competence development ComFB family protein [Clostridiales Family XIII bacterium]
MTQAKHEPINLVLQMAEGLLPSVMRKVGLEDTPENRADALALALNAMPSKYITTGGGKSYTQFVENYRHQYETDILSNLTRAALKVKQSPRGEAREDAGDRA